MLFPTTRKHKDTSFIFAELKLFKTLDLAVRDEYVYQKIDGTKSSWDKWGPLENWIANMFNLAAPTEYLEMLKQNCTCITKQGEISKIAPKIELFPKLKLEVFLVEFKDTLYALRTGQLIGFHEIAPETATFC